MHIIQFKVQSSKEISSKFKGKVIIQFKVQNSKFKGNKFKGKVNERFSNYCERRYG